MDNSSKWAVKALINRSKNSEEFGVWVELMLTLLKFKGRAVYFDYCNHIIFVTSLALLCYLRKKTQLNVSW